MHRFWQVSDERRGQKKKKKSPVSTEQSLCACYWEVPSFIHSINYSFIHPINLHICPRRRYSHPCFTNQEAEARSSSHHQEAEEPGLNPTLCSSLLSYAAPLGQEKTPRPVGQEKILNKVIEEEGNLHLLKVYMGQLLCLHTFYMKIYLFFLWYDHYHTHFKAEKTEVWIGQTSGQTGAMNQNRNLNQVWESNPGTTSQMNKSISVKSQISSVHVVILFFSFYS